MFVLHIQAALQTAFHVPASLVLPAMAIHKVVHVASDFVSKHAKLSALPQRQRALIPVAAAVLAIVPVVPLCDHGVEFALENTLAPALGLSLHHETHHEPAHEKHE